MDYCIKCSQPLFHGTIPHRCIADILCPSCAAKDAELERLTNKLNTDSQNFEILALRETERILRARIDDVEGMAKMIHADSAAHHLMLHDITRITRAVSAWRKEG